MDKIVISATDPMAREFHGQYGAYNWCAAIGRQENFGYTTFKSHIQRGHIIGHELREDDFLRARFGIELMRDAAGPYISFIYYAGSFKLGYLEPICNHLLKLSAMYMNMEGQGGPGRLYVYGRAMWKHIFGRAGMTVNDGWIDAKQEAFSHGRFRRIKQRETIE